MTFARQKYEAGMTIQSATFALQLEQLTYSRHDMGHLDDGRTVFVPFGLAGERVRVLWMEEKRILDGILSLNPRVIAFVSCDPSTLALGARRLINGGYTLKDVRPLDLFPQTYHLESISFFEQ